MGCSINSNLRLQNGSKIKMKKQLKLSASTFIQENRHNFSDVYRLGRTLGTGIYGEVRLCFHRTLNSKRAVKIININLMTNQSLRENLNKEIEILKSLDHPNIIRIYEFFEELNRLYIVMEYCKGGELFTQIVKKKQLSESNAAKIMSELFSCLQYLHINGIVHRDIKPENVLLEEKNEMMNIKIIDFGAATVFQSNSKLRGVIGTLNYIAPEVLSGCYDHLCDLWSCGVILYILLCGNPPFTGKNESEIKENILQMHYNIKNPEWQGVSVESKNLISSLLCPEDSRLTAEQALNHNWTQKFIIQNHISTEAVSTALNNLKDFRSVPLLRDAINSYIMSQFISNTDTKELREVFRKMDTNGDGKLSKQELFDEYKKKLDEKEAKQLVEQIMLELNSDENGFIDYSEFLKACLDEKKVLSFKNLQMAFEMFDQDGNGKISVNELKEMIIGRGYMDNRIWNEIFVDIQRNEDGEIGIEEFKKIVLKKGIYED